MKISYKFKDLSHYVLFLSSLPSLAIASTIPISQDPVLKSTSVPGNVALALSVEFPTALVNAHKDKFTSGKKYLGYFDPMKCYAYHKEANDADSYFEPIKFKQAINSTCESTSPWDGNFMNWAVTSTIDPFRWVMTGGNRSRDDNKTYLLKSYDNDQKASGQSSLFPNREVKNLESGRTGLSSNNFTLILAGQGNHANFRTTSTIGKNTTTTDNKFFIQVQVCKEDLLEENCKEYKNTQGTPTWKPEGLIQKYANDLRFSAFGYLNEKNQKAGVMRAPMRFVGPKDEFASADPSRNNPHAEWDAETGILRSNPHTAEAEATAGYYGTTINNSGLINYINKFGQESHKYKFDDPVSDLFYAVARYYMNKGSKSNWYSLASNINKSEALDGFPVIINWEDPIKFSCQKNSILGIGDIFTQQDGGELKGNDLGIDIDEERDKIKNKETDVNWSGANERMRIAALASYINKNDIRNKTFGNELPIKQSIQTYWVDVLEENIPRYNNQYYLATKYGGAPDWGKDGNPLNWSSGEIIKLYKQSGSAEKSKGTEMTVERPKNYFLAGDPDSMKKGLEAAFDKMSWEAKNLSTSPFSLVSNDLTHHNTYYSASYDSQYWSGNIKAHKIDENGDVVIDSDTKKPKIIWQTQDKLAKTIQNDYTKRNVLTWKWGDDKDSPILFKFDNLSAAQKESLNTSYISGDDSQDFAKWLLGYVDTKYRSRLGEPDAKNQRYFNPLGDIINSKIVASGAPSQAFSEADNPGYKKFKEDKKSRETLLFVGANDGMLHAIRTAGDKGGEELFAYIPSSLFLPEAGSPSKEAVLTKLGQHYYNHRNYVDATVAVADVDFKRSGNTNHKNVDVKEYDWRSILVGGLGAGGYQYYAIDVTNPDSFQNAANAPQNLLWEFPRRNQIPKALGGECSNDCIDIGMTFGTPNIIKNNKYGWVVAVTSGYNNASGKGKLYLLNPQNGEVLETHTTTKSSNGLAHTTAFMPLSANMLADSVYGGDINGQVWRFDLTGTTEKSADGTYPAHLLAELASPSTAQAQPITTRPIVQVHPKDRKRYVLIGTGRLLDSTDLEDKQAQSFYALIDGTADRFSAKTIKRATLGNAGPEAVIANKATVTADGWVMDLGIGNAQSKDLSWRMIFPASVSGGNVSFTSILPVADYCQGTGSSRLYAIDFMRGETILPKAQATPQPYLERNFVIFDTKFVRFKGKTKLGGGGGDSQIVLEDLNTKKEPKGQLSWREIPVTQ